MLAFRGSNAAASLKRVDQLRNDRPPLAAFRGSNAAASLKLEVLYPFLYIRVPAFRGSNAAASLKLAGGKKLRLPRQPPSAAALPRPH